jgi:hypothetical protein
MIVLQEYEPYDMKYTGSPDIWLKIVYILNEQPFVPEGYICMSTVKGTVHDGY